MTEEGEPTSIPDQEEEEDESLDDFFKKKDKKGKKKKKKKNELGDTETKSKSKKDPSGKTDSEATKDGKADGNHTHEQEEWIDFEDESQRDYSDLKIQNLQLSDSLTEVATEPVPEYNEAGELLPPKVDEGPWNKTLATSNEAEAAPVEEAPKKLGAYRPPGARLGGDSGPRRMKKQQAPEINSVMDFPTLSAAAEDIGPQKGFEVVKSGAKAAQATSSGGVQPWRPRRLMNQQSQPAELKLGNQFSALNTSH